MLEMPFWVPPALREIPPELVNEVCDSPAFSAGNMAAGQVCAKAGATDAVNIAVKARANRPDFSGADQGGSTEQAAGNIR